MNLLFAEDERDLSDAVKRILEINGYSVDAVYDGAEALKHAQSEKYDGLFLTL